MSHLFALPSDSIKVTSDDCYTPRWVFDAMGLQFDLDVAAPIGGPWHVPATRYYTAEDDGLTASWDGLVWCNPPYSSFAAWADRWLAHDRGLLMGMMLPQTRWTKRVLMGCDALTFCGIGTGGSRGGREGFVRPDGTQMRPRTPVFIAFRGVGIEPAERLAAADPYGAVLYGNPAPTAARRDEEA